MRALTYVYFLKMCYVVSFTMILSDKFLVENIPSELRWVTWVPKGGVPGSTPGIF